MLGCKIVLIGDAGVGKTSFCRSCYAREPQLHCTPTVGLDFHSILVNYSQGQVKCFLWDTAGQERFRSLVYVYYRNTHAVLCFYDVTSRSSFQNVKSWLETINTVGSPLIMIVGNKVDLPRQVSREEGEALALSLGTWYAECSVSDYSGLEEILVRIVEKLHRKLEPSPPPSPPSAGYCC
ncbi:MAG: Rab family GTPase [Nitrososphaerales archaeon]